MARLTAPSTPRKRTTATSKRSPAQGPPSARAAVPVVPERAPIEEPVWLVRIVLVLFFVGFAAFLAREAYAFAQSLP